MLFIVAALALMGVLLGAAAHTPLPVFLAASGVIGAPARPVPERDPLSE